MRLCEYGDWRDDFVSDTEVRRLFLDRLAIEDNPQPGAALRIVRVHHGATRCEEESPDGKDDDLGLTYEIVCLEVGAEDIEQVFQNTAAALEARMHQANRESMCKMIRNGWRPDAPPGDPACEPNPPLRLGDLVTVLVEWLVWLRAQLDGAARVLLIDMDPKTLEPIWPDEDAITLPRLSDFEFVYEAAPGHEQNNQAEQGIVDRAIRDAMADEIEGQHDPAA